MASSFKCTLRRVARIHFWLLFFALASYLMLGFTLGPRFFAVDLQEKIHALADEIIVVTATVLGPPATPIVSATPVCVSGVPRVFLDWADDTGTTTWSVERDTLPLVTGLTSSTYTDTAVVALTSYNYVVVAYGPMGPGIATSATVSVTTLDCTNVTPPSVLIQTIGDTNVSTDRSGIVLSRRRPKITGTTNIPNAIIDILLTNPTMQARITANANGYFAWIPPLKLHTGNHYLTVTATDPNDSSRTVSDSFIFRTKNDREGPGEREEETAPPVGLDLDFSVQVDNTDSTLFQGDVVGLTVRSLRGAFPAGVRFTPVFVDHRGHEVLRFPTTAIESSGQTELRFSKKFPLSLSPGTYQMRVDAVFGRALVSREARLIVRAWPLLDLGGGREITYPEVVRFVGLIFYTLFTLFFFYLLFFFREYLASLRSLRHISEYHLARFGFIPKRRKEVRR